MKKFATMAICFVLIACMVAGGSLAYLTDRDSTANVFTVGDVRIELTEDFEQGAKLTPGVDIEKAPKITNTGLNDAYVWLEFAIPAALDTISDKGNAEGSSNNVVHWNYLGATADAYANSERIEKAFAEGKLAQDMFPTDVTNCEEFILNKGATWDYDNKYVKDTNMYQNAINGVMYNIYVIPYNKALEPGETTLPGIVNIYLDKQIDIDTNGDWYKVNKGIATKYDWNTNENGAPIIYVSAYAIQAEGFTTVADAYAAYVSQWFTEEGVNNGAEWAKPVMPVTSAEDLADELANGNSVTLKEDIATTEMISIADGAESSIDLNNNTLTGTIENNGGNVVVSDGTIEQSGNNVLYNEGNAEITNVTANMTDSTGYITNSRTDDSITVFNNVDFTSTGGGVNVWNGEAVFNSGVITTNSTSTSARHVFYVADGAKLTINDGEFTFNPTNLTRKGSYLCAHGADATIIVNGGTFHKPSTRTAPIQEIDGGSVTIYGGTFEFDPSAFVADGYVATEANGWWTVIAE